MLDTELTLLPCTAEVRKRLLQFQVSKETNAPMCLLGLQNVQKRNMPRGVAMMHDIYQPGTCRLFYECRRHSSL